jgi:hypothetical protein
MNRRTKLMAVLAAFVAATLLIVYALGRHEALPDPAIAAPAGSSTESSENKPSEAAPSEPAPLEPLDRQSEAGRGETDLDRLPEETQETLRDIVVAAQAGDLEEMRAVLEQNELRPMLSKEKVGDPIDYWKKTSVDGEGRDVLAAILNVFSSSYAKKGEDGQVTFVWPYLAELDLTKLTPAQEVELYRIVPPAEAEAMKKSGKYTYYRAGIGADGVWHYFMK